MIVLLLLKIYFQVYYGRATQGSESYPGLSCWKVLIIENYILLSDTCVHPPFIAISQQKSGIFSSQPGWGKSWSVPSIKQRVTLTQLAKRMLPTQYPSLPLLFFQAHIFFWLFQYFPSALTEDFPNPLGSSQEPLSSRNSKFFAALFLTVKMLGSSLSLFAV